MMIDAAKLYTLIPVYVTLILIQKLRGEKRPKNPKKTQTKTNKQTKSCAHYLTKKS